MNDLRARLWQGLGFCIYSMLYVLFGGLLGWAVVTLVHVWGIEPLRAVVRIVKALVMTVVTFIMNA
jgi:hypothetical protein